MALGILRFEEGYFARIWGGRQLEDLWNKPLPSNEAVGEAWLIADHAVHDSVVAQGPHRGRTLHELVEEYSHALLGRLAPPTPFGRFPLLLKLLDARDVLSVQVHPDDACAKRLDEPDVGKTEMWYVLDAEPGSELICGLDPGLARNAFAGAVADGSIAGRLCRYPVRAGSAVFVPAGIVHAIGAGLVLAEIQQNSDLTYRLYDWDRTDDRGAPRPLHIEKAMAATHFGERHPGLARPLEYSNGDLLHTVLAACSYFAAEHIEVGDDSERATHGDSFHIVLIEDGPLEIEGVTLLAGQAALIPADCPAFSISGTGTFLDYYVPDIKRDIRRPLLAAGHSKERMSELIHEA